VIIACTAAKLGHPAPAGRIYTGVTWATWRKHGPDDLGVPWGWSLWALSAEHGLVSAATTIAPYNRRLTHARAKEMGCTAKTWLGHIKALAVMDDRGGEHDWHRVEAVVIGGSEYQRLAEAIGVDIVLRIDGAAPRGERGGIGLLRQRLAAWASGVRHAIDASPWGDVGWPIREEGRACGTMVRIGGRPR